MAKFDYDRIVVNTVLPSLEKYGNPISLVRDADLSLWDREYDPITEEFSWTNKQTGQVVTTEPEDDTYTGDGVFVQMSDELLSNTLVKASDKVLLVQAIPTPKTGDRVVDHAGITYQYVTHIPISPGGTNVLYKIAVRL